MDGWQGLVSGKESSSERVFEQVTGTDKKESQCKRGVPGLGRQLVASIPYSIKHPFQRHPKHKRLDEEEEEEMKVVIASYSASDPLIIPPSPRKWSLTSSRLGVSIILLMAAAVFLLNLEAVYNPSHAGRKHFGFDFTWSHFPDDTPSLPNLLPGRLGDDKQELFMCDRSHPRTDVCYMKGDVRMESKTSSFVLYARDESTRLGEERIKPYTRKWEQSTMDIVHEVKLKSVRSSSDNNSSGCDVVHSVPGVVFTTGGYTGNVYHEFHDGLIPLYITSQHLKGQVVFIGVEFHNWWLTKYADVVAQMSNYSIIDFDRDERVHCFPEVTVGVHIHDELAVHPALMPHNESIVDFRNLLDRAYTPHPGELEELNNSNSSGEFEELNNINNSSGELEEVNNNNSTVITTLNDTSPDPPRPRLTIIVRNDTRVILNLDAVVETATEVGFEVNLVQPTRTSELKKMYWALNSSHVLMGVHGAAMTHFLFMRPGTVFIQVIPLGASWAASAYYGEPAQKLGLEYVGYEIKAEESSLIDKYDRNSDILTSPDEVAKQGWEVVKQVYLDGQNVRLSLPRLRRTLLIAKSKALKAMSALDRR